MTIVMLAKYEEFNIEVSRNLAGKDGHLWSGLGRLEVGLASDRSRENG